MNTHAEQGNRLLTPLCQGLAAELEAGQSPDAALARDEALALAQRTSEHWTDSLLLLIRGGVLLTRDPADSGGAEDAFLTAIDIAQAQKARSFELRAALALARQYQSSGHAADAHTVLAPALEGFAPTPEFPEIEEAQALLTVLKR